MIPEDKERMIDLKDFDFSNVSIKMIGLDLDGTTLSESSKLTEYTKRILEEALARGIEIIIATGRAEVALPEEVLNIKGLRYVATSNGARVIDIIEKKTVYENYIDEKRIPDIHRLLTSRDADIEVFYDGVAYIGRREYDSIVSGENTTRNKEYIMATRKPADNIYDLLLENADRIENINVNYRTLDQKPSMQEALLAIGGVEITSSVPHNNEIGGETTSKGDALRFLMERAGLERDNIMAFGDNPNDLEMIRFAKVGVAMGNAEDIVKEEADIVTLPNYMDGVAFAIESLVFDRPMGK